MNRKQERNKHKEYNKMYRTKCVFFFVCKYERYTENNSMRYESLPT